MVESLIKEVNHRVKGTEKFWNRPEGAENILQVRAAALRDDDRLSQWILNRTGSYFYRRSTGQDKHHEQLASAVLKANVLMHPASGGRAAAQATLCNARFVGDNDPHHQDDGLARPSD
jgi:hypothetical protein